MIFELKVISTSTVLYYDNDTSTGIVFRRRIWKLIVYFVSVLIIQEINQEYAKKSSNESRSYNSYTTSRSVA